MSITNRVRAAIGAAALLMVIAVGGTASAQEPKLIGISVPADWRIAHRNDDGRIRVTELMPRGQTRENWREMVAIQIYRGLPIAPERYLEEQERIFRQNCSGFSATATTRGEEGGDPVAFRTLNCDSLKESRYGELILMKVVRNGGMLYALSRSWRLGDGAGEPTERELNRWADILKDSRLCDQDQSTGACPTNATLY